MTYSTGPYEPWNPPSDYPPPETKTRRELSKNIREEVGRQLELVQARVLGELAATQNVLVAESKPEEMPHKPRLNWHYGV